MGKSATEKFKMGKSAKSWLSIYLREIQFPPRKNDLQKIEEQNGEISNREIQNGEISKILAIYLSAGNSNIFAGTPAGI